MISKGNDGTGDIPERDSWETQQELFDLLDKQFSFTFDCCADKKNTKCVNFTDDFLSRQKDYLADDNCWMNPPFSKAKEMFEHFFKVVRRGVAIYRCDNMETAVWQDIILKHATWVFIPKGRVSYTHGNKYDGKGTRFPSALIGFNIMPVVDIKGITLMVDN